MSNSSSYRLRTIKSFLSFWGLMLLLVIGVFWLSAKLVEPAPPKHAVIITGREDGAYYAVAKKYAEIFKQNGIDLAVRPSAGSVENYQALLQPDGDVDLAIVQGGTLPSDPLVKKKIEGIASLYLEPMWVFYRFDKSPAPLGYLSQLAGRRVAIGENGSGTQSLALLLLSDCGVPNDPKLLLPTGGAQAVSALKAGEIDAAIFIASPDSPMIHELIQSPNIALASLVQAKAMARTRQFLSPVTLYPGSIDLAKHLPQEEVELVAPAAILVARESAHKSLVLLGAMSATQINRSGTLLCDPGQFPSARYLEVPIAKESEHYLAYGPSIMQRLFPFWLASFLDRILIMLLPLATLLIPLVRFAPSLYRWRIRSRIYRWYKQIRAIDEKVVADAVPATLNAHLEQIGRIEDEVRSVHVPLSYMEDLYQLRMHLNLLEEKIRVRLPRGQGS